MKKCFILALLTFSAFSFTNAQVTIGQEGGVEDSQLTCTELSYTLKLRSKDATTNNEVTELQNFLLDVGLLDADPTGYFGATTLKAVKAFQRQNGLLASGLVGSFTRKAIKERSCNTNVVKKVIETKQKDCAIAPDLCNPIYPSDPEKKAYEPVPKKVVDTLTPNSSTPSIEVYKVSVPYVYVTFTNLPKSEVDMVSVSTGVVVHNQGLTNGGSDSAKINFVGNTVGAKDLPSGNYYLRVLEMGGTGGEVARTKSFYVGGKDVVTTPTPTPAPTVEAHGPGKNAMLCSKPAQYGLSNGQVGCYGIWDYGNEFGSDPDMCPGWGSSDGQRRTGCIVSTPACASGKATASKMAYPTSMSADSPELAVYAKNLKSSTEAIRQQIPTLWEYTCISQTTIDTANAQKQAAVTAIPTVTSSGAELHAIGVYEAGSDHSFCYSTTGSVSVTVKNTGKPIILAASSYEPVSWDITLEPGAQLERVIIGGYGVQKVKGIPSSVPVTMLTYMSLDNVDKGVSSGNGAFYDLRNPDNGIYYHWASNAATCPKSAAVPVESRGVFRSTSNYYAGYKVGGEGYDKWIDKLKELTGVRPTSFQGDYTKTSFTISGASPVPVTPQIQEINLPSMDNGGGGQSFNISAGPQVLGASTMCINLVNNIHRGDESSQTKLLQTFLISKGLLEGEVTGFFGDKTIEAVKAYQRSVKLPETGMVYDFTRKAILDESCR